jgi:ABC-2 type transport system ATP-binding protein
MRRTVAALSTATVAAALLAATTGAGAPSGAATPAVTVRTLHFAVKVGPHNGTTCDVIGDLYQPRGASPTHRVPAILTSNGFGGSKDDQKGLGQAFARRGYEVLSYSGLGFGGSGCKITLDDPQWDGKAGRQLISFLGGEPGIAFTDAAHTHKVAPLQVVRRDRRDHAGRHDRYDPRVGTIGGSYGGGNQFAIASVDPRLDTMVPFITWNDLTYSLDPNNTDQVRGVTTSNPGAIKLTWGLLFSADGAADGLSGGQQDPSRLYGCPNFPTFVCTALATGATTGYFQPDALKKFRHASVAHFMKRIRIPTLLIQGENDTLFNLNEAAATYRALRAQHTPVKMIWQSWGHSQSTPAKGELNLAEPNPRTQYETERVAAWFDHYLRGHRHTSTGPRFAYFRDWVKYTGIATPAYASADHFPVGTASVYTLSGTNTLRPGRHSHVASGSQQFATPAGGPPTSLNRVDVIGSYTKQRTFTDSPANSATWTGPKLGHRMVVVGSPTLSLTLSSPTSSASQGTGPDGQLVLFVKIADVAGDGTAHLIKALEAPIRVANVDKPFTVRLPGVVHRFAVGHRVRLVVAAGSPNYRGGSTENVVTIASGPGQQLRLPVTQG